MTDLDTAGSGDDLPDDDFDPLPGEGDPVATGPKGGGEWPSPSTPPTGSAPGTDPRRQAELEAERTGQARRDEEGSAAELHPPAHLDPPREQVVGPADSDALPHP